MATEQVKQSINMFAGGMDLDSSDQTLQAGKYRLSKNLRFVADGDSNEGSLTLILGVGETIVELKEPVMWSGNIGDLGVAITRDKTEDYQYYWNIYTFNLSHAVPQSTVKKVFGPCYEELGTKLSVVTSDENDTIKKIYIADGEHPLAVVNVCKEYNSGDYELITTTPKVDLRPIKFAGYCDGGIKSGMVQYAYRLVDKYIRFSTISPFTGLIPVGNFYKDQKNNKYDTKCCGVKLYIPNLENTGYSHVRLYRIYQKSIETQPVVYQLQDVRVSKDFYYSDQDDSQVVDELQVEELYDNINIIPTVIESKNNRLFAANIKKLETEDLFEDWDARAYQSTADGVCTIYNYSNRSKYFAFDINDVDNIERIPVDFDCYNEVNDVNTKINFNACQRYCLVDKDRYYGGTGKNVSWRFVTTNLAFTSDKDQKFPFINMLEINTDFSSKPIYKIDFCGNKVLIGGSAFTFDSVKPDESYGGNTYRNPFISYALKSLRRDELYRYGIILYDSNDNRSQVKWIADIRVPSADTPGFETFTSGSNVYVHPIGIQFDVTLPNGCNKYEIVRCRVRGEDTATVTQGIIQKPMKWMSKNDDNEYFSSGLYTVAPYVTSSADVMDLVTTEALYDKDWVGGYQDWCAAIFPGMALSIDKDVTELYETESNLIQYKDNVYKSQASNIFTKNLFCLASPEITFYPDSFKSQLSSIDKIQTISYIYPNEQHWSAIYNKIYDDYLLPVGQSELNEMPLGVRLNQKKLDTNEIIFRDSPLLTAGTRYGMVSSEHYTHAGRDKYQSKEYGMLPYAKHNLSTNDTAGHKITDKSISYPYINNDSPLSWSYDTHRIRHDDYVCTMSKSTMDLSWIGQLKKENYINLPTTRKIVLDSFKLYDKMIATSFAYIKLLNRSNAVNVSQIDMNDDGNLNTSSKDKKEGVGAVNEYKIYNKRVATVYNQSVTGNNDSSEYIGTYKFTNFVLTGGCNQRRSLLAHYGAMSEQGLLYGMLPVAGMYVCANGNTDPQTGLTGKFIGAIYSNDDVFYDRTVSGYAGECMAFTIDDKDSILNKEFTGVGSDACQLFGTYLTNVRKSNVVPYGGHGQNNISVSTYNSYGDVFTDNTAIVFDGNCYISAFEYCSMYKHAGKTGEHFVWNGHTNEEVLYNGGYLTQSIYYCFPVETTMNLNLLYGNSVSDQVYNALKDIKQNTNDDDTYFNALLPTMTQFKADMLNMHDTTYSHDRDHYMFNNSYQNDNSAGLHQAKDTLTTEEIVEFNRCYYSQEKQPLDILDGFLHFLAANYIDVDNRYGEITYLKEFKNQLLFWQTEAFGVFSVNERVQVNTPNSQTLQLGTGGVLDRYDYYSNFYGMRKNDHAVVTSAAQLYFWDANKKTLLNYYGGNLSNMNLTHKVSSYFDKIEVSDKPRQFYDRDNNEVLFLVSTKDENIVFNETVGLFTSIYTFAYDHSISFPNEQYLIDRYGKIKKWNDCLNDEAMSWDVEFTPYVQFVVNGEAQANKVFDNQEICGNISDRDLAFRYTTPLKQEGNATQKDLTNREMDYKLAVPRDNYVTYGGRLRGRTMVVEISSTSNRTDFSLDYVITKFRRSLT